MGLKALGFEDLADAVSDEEMGNIVITGDIHGTDAKSVIDSLSGLQQGSKQDQSAPQMLQQSSNTLAKTLAAAGLLMGASSLPIVAWNLTRPTEQSTIVVPPSTDRDTDTKYGLQIYRDE